MMSNSLSPTTEVFQLLDYLRNDYEKTERSKSYIILILS